MPDRQSHPTDGAPAITVPTAAATLRTTAGAPGAGAVGATSADHPTAGSAGASPTEPRPSPAVAKAAIVRQLQPIVTATPGVAAMVPSMRTAVRRLRPDRGSPPTVAAGTDSDNASENTPNNTSDSASDSSSDGITVSLIGASVTVRLDITVIATASVLDTALAVHAAADKLLEPTHPGRHTVSVNVLGLEPGQSRHSPPSKRKPRSGST